MPLPIGSGVFIDAVFIRYIFRVATKQCGQAEVSILPFVLSRQKLCQSYYIVKVGKRKKTYKKLKRTKK